jgi:hypothetical protein
MAVQRHDITIHSILPEDVFKGQTIDTRQKRKVYRNIKIMNRLGYLLPSNIPNKSFQSDKFKIKFVDLIYIKLMYRLAYEQDNRKIQSIRFIIISLQSIHAVISSLAVKFSLVAKNIGDRI